MNADHVCSFKTNHIIFQVRRNKLPRYFYQFPQLSKHNQNGDRAYPSVPRICSLRRLDPPNKLSMIWTEQLRTSWQPAGCLRMSWHFFLPFSDWMRVLSICSFSSFLWRRTKRLPDRKLIRIMVDDRMEPDYFYCFRLSCNSGCLCRHYGEKPNKFKTAIFCRIEISSMTNNRQMWYPIW